jgi:hypothetical protein
VAAIAAAMMALRVRLNMWASSWSWSAGRRLRRTLDEARAGAVTAA